MRNWILHLRTVLAVILTAIAVFADAASAADCTTGGTMKFNSSSAYYEYCDGANWVDMTTGTGASCSGETGKLRYSSGQFEFCDASNWRTAKGSSLGSCVAADAGKITYSSPAMKFCDGSNWYKMTSATVEVDETPSAFTFTDVTGQLLNTQVISNIVQITGFDSGAVNVTAVEGSPEFRVCSDSTCTAELRTWGTSSYTMSGGSYVQLRITTAPSGPVMRTAVVTIGRGTDAWNVTTQPRGYFVLSSTTYDGDDLGSLANADTECLNNILGGNTFLDKANATLNSTTVKAWLCNGSGCNNLTASTTYQYGLAGGATTGGGTFWSDGNSRGPGEATAWSAATRFNTTANVWTGRASTGANQFNNTADTRHCTGWSATGVNGQYGVTSGTNATRWLNGTGIACTNAQRIICMVNPADGTPAAYDFTDQTGVARSAVISSNIVQITGISSATPVNVSGSGSPEVRVCSDGSCNTVLTNWTSASTTVNNNEYLQVRQTSSDSPGTGRMASIAVGSIGDNWTVTTTAVTNYFVLSASSYNGNRGGLSGANATCLTELQSNNWLGKELAAVDSAHVRAFLCTSTGCNNLAASTTYNFARAGSATAGGATFTTNSSGAGPGNGSTWSNGTLFGVSVVPWGRPQNTSNLWQVTPQTSNNCSNWTSSSSGQSGVVGDTNRSDERRFDDGNANCNTSQRLLCYTVAGGNDPAAFDFTDVSNATTVSDVTSNIVQITGITSAGVTISGTGTPMFRVCSDPACSSVDTTWTSSYTAITNGKYLQLKLTTPGNATTARTAAVAVGLRNDSWSVTTGAIDSTPDAVDFVDQTLAVASTQYASDIIQITGLLSADVTIAGASGTPEFRVCADASCGSVLTTWGTASVAISNNQYVQVHMTSGLSGTNTLTLTVGTAAIDWAVTVP